MKCSVITAQRLTSMLQTVREKLNQQGARPELLADEREVLQQMRGFEMTIPDRSFALRPPAQAECDMIPRETDKESMQGMPSMSPKSIEDLLGMPMTVEQARSFYSAKKETSTTNTKALLNDYLERRLQPPSPQVQAKRARLLKKISELFRSH
jgi:hypothetical protein